MGRIWTRDDWNDIIRRVNALGDSGRSAGTQLEEVPENHIWTKDDVATLRDRLTAMCANATSVNIPLNKWAKDIIDEIENAIEGCECCNPDSDDYLTFSPIPLHPHPYGADHWVLYYIDPAGLQFGQDNIIGRAADITVVGAQWSGGTYNKCSSDTDVLIDCQGHLLPETWYSPQGSGDTSAAPALAAQGFIPVIDVHDWLKDYVWYQPPWTATMYAQVMINTHNTNYFAWQRCTNHCFQPGYHASIGGTLLGTCPLSTYRAPIAAAYPNKWWSSLAALESSIESYNRTHTPQLAIQNVNPWTAYYSPTPRYTALANGCFFVSLAYV